MSDTIPPGAVMGPNNIIAVLKCPDCGTLQVINPVWLTQVGSTMDFECDNCCDEKHKPHLILAFKLIPIE